MPISTDDTKGLTKMLYPARMGKKQTV